MSDAEPENIFALQKSSVDRLQQRTLSAFKILRAPRRQRLN